MREKKLKHRNRKLELAFLLLTLLVIPAFFVFEVFSYIENGRFENNSNELKDKFKEISRQSLDFVDLRAFWNNFFNNEFKSNSDIISFSKPVAEAEKLSNKKLQYAIWDKNSVLLKSNIDVSPKNKRHLKNLALYLKNANSSSNNVRFRNFNMIRKILGAHFYLDDHEIGENYVAAGIRRFDIDKNKPMVWLGKSKAGTAVIMFPEDFFVGDIGIKKLIEKHQKLISSFIFTENGKAKRITGKIAFQKMDSIVATVEDAGADKVFQIKNRLYILKKLPGKKQVFVESTPISLPKAGKHSMLVVIFMAFVLLIFLKEQVSGINDIGRFSLRTQISIMLFIAIGLPSLFLSIPSFQYFTQKKNVMMNTKTHELINFIQNIDRSSQNEFSKVLFQIKRAQLELEEILAKNFNPMDVSRVFFKYLGRDNITNYFLVDEKTETMYGKSTYFRNGRLHWEYANTNDANLNDPQATIIYILGKYFVGMMNDEKLQNKPPMDREYLFEMFFQKPMDMVVNDLVRDEGEICKANWIDLPFFRFTKAIQYPQKNRTRALLMVNFFPEIMQNNFLKKNFLQINRNPEGFVFFASLDEKFYPETFYKLPEKDYFFKKISLYPDTKPLLVELNGKEYLYVGLWGHFLSKARLIGLYPMEKIESQISKEKQSFIEVVLGTILIICSLVALFNFGLIFPIKQLHLAANALEKRDFSFRTSKLPDDEFGDMAKIFNASMSDLQELSIAQTVQSRLFPPSGIKSGDFQIFGKSVSMAELGGDYFDYFPTVDKHFAILLGDVAGHGVGASLIMAMAKAGIMYSDELLTKPSQMLDGLHKMIHATRSKTQRKVMTFQYFSFDSDTGEALYSNAGGCSPILVDPIKNTTSEIFLQGPVLGGFKKSTFAETKILVRPGQALVLYTDGIVETRNPQGEEIGYERFGKMLLDCYDPDSELFFKKVYDKYLLWLGSGQPQDDLTLIMLTRR